MQCNPWETFNLIVRLPVVCDVSITVRLDLFLVVLILCPVCLFVTMSQLELCN